MPRRYRLLLLLCSPLWGQAALTVRVIEGDGVVYSIGSRATRGVTVEVADATGRPVDGASVRFELPSSGASGTFADGGRTATMLTGADGRAQVWGMQWNREAGPFEVRITATRGTLTAGTRAQLSLTRAAVSVDAGSPTTSRSRKKLWIALAVAGGAGIAVLGLAAKPAAAGSTPVNAPQIGVPTITIGRP